MAKYGRPLVMPAEERCKEIYAAAEKLFGEKGFAHVTMAEIATAAGMSKKTLYVHFADKRELLKSLISSSYLWSAQVVAVEQATQPIESLKQHLAMIAEYVLSERHLKLCRLAIAENYGFEGMAETFHQMGIATSRKSLMDSIQQIPHMQCKLNLEPALIADMLFGGVIGSLLIEALMATGPLEHDWVKIRHNIEQLVDAIFSSNVLTMDIPCKLKIEE